MGDPMVPERPGGRHAAAREQAGIPAMPVISPGERDLGGAHPLLDGVSPTIGWQLQPQAKAKGGLSFVILRRTGLGGLKVVESFPLTEDGWAHAWQSLATHNPAAVPQVLAKLKAREADAARLRGPALDASKLLELDARSMASLRDLVYLGGHVPESPIRAGERCDVRFVEDRLMVFASRRAEVLAEVPYSQVEDMEIGGPGMVRSGGGFTGGGYGLSGAVEGMAIAAVLNAITTRTSIKTIVRIQGTGCELFLLHTKMTPEQLRIEMSRTLGVIRAARADEAARPSPEARTVSPSPVEELAKLADMLEKGLLTREEFDLMKAKIIGLLTIRRYLSGVQRFQIGPWAGMMAIGLSEPVRLAQEVVRPGGSRVGSQRPVTSHGICGCWAQAILPAMEVQRCRSRWRSFTRASPTGEPRPGQTISTTTITVR